jgi:thiamine-monophosphate kinase
MKKIKDIGESGLLQLIKEKVPCYYNIKKGIGDDTAVIKWDSKKYLLFTTDTLVEGIHFNTNQNPIYVGRKALAISVSDIAAMGGIPKFALISLALPKRLSLHYFNALYKGIFKIAKEFYIKIVGGNISESPVITLSSSLIGFVEKKNLVLRNGAKEQDIIFLTGKVGGSLTSFRHLTFQPRIKIARYLVKKYKIHSMIDISDGLISDLGKLLKESQKGAILYEEAIPLNKRAKDFKYALYEGEDFELLFTVSLKEARRLLSDKKFIFYPIGKVTKRKGLLLLNKDNRPRKIKVQGYEHFLK